jgi:hypothetical protein
VGNLELRLSKLEEQRQRAAGETILRLARAASTDNLARFVLARDLAPEGESFEVTEEEAWRYLGVSMEMAQLANQQDGWAEKLGDLLAARPGLLHHMHTEYPEATQRRYPLLCSAGAAPGVNPTHERRLEQ